MSEQVISLFELLNLAIGTPQRGAVNFSALHALLHAVLRQLDIQETPWKDAPPGEETPSTGEQPGQKPGQRDGSTGERGAASSGPAEDCQLSRIQTCEDGVSKNMKLIQDLHQQRDNLKEEVKEEMKEEMEEMKEEMKEEMEEMKKLCHQQQVGAEPESEVEQCCHRVAALEESVRSLRDAVQKSPDPEELSRCVTWDVMESALLSQRDAEPEERGHSGAVDASTEVKATEVKPTEVSMDAGTSLQTRPATGLTAAGISERYSETLEALRVIGTLEARVAALEEGKADRVQLNHLAERITDQSSRDAWSNLTEQLDQQRALIDGLLSDRDKLDGLEDMFMNLSSQDSRSVAPLSEESDSRAAHELRQQVSYVRKSVKKLEEDVKQLKATQALCVERTDGDLQDQLDDLRGTLEDMMLSLTSRLSEAVRDEGAGSRGLGPGKEGSALATSTVNTGRKLSLLFQHYERLQDTVSSLLQQQSGGRAGPPDGENVELVDDVQKAILQLQAECEKLHESSRSLADDSRERRSHIEELFKTTEELQEKKADKQLVESGLKADKCALESKVSRLQFDSVTEQLNGMFHELLSRVTGQEQDWTKVIDRLSTEMECKLNRMELDSVKKQLEDRWKNIHQKLQAQGAPEHEDAAGIRKQLVDRFHCLSCDRPVVMHTHGQHLLKLPSSPGFPSHKSIRPFTVYALEQFRQHYRSLKPGTNHLNLEVVIRRREQLQRSHAVMCSQIESMQRTLRHGDRPSSHHTTGDNVIHNQNQNQNQTGILHERVSEVTDYSHQAVSRSCGGSHTVTSASQRRTGLQAVKHHPQAEVDQVDQSEEVDIIGLDGHIYKGRLNAPARNTETKLPTISTKDGKTKDKAKCSLPLKPSTSPEVHLPPSVRSAQCSRSASSSSGRDWPVSALGCTSQSSVTPASAAAETDEPLDL